MVMAYTDDVRPCSISGHRRGQQPRTAARIVSVWAVARNNVCDLVARVKSLNRSRKITVRPTRRAVRNRRVMRSTRATATASMSPGVFGRRPSAHCEPIERRRRPTCTGRGSRL